MRKILPLLLVPLTLFSAHPARGQSQRSINSVREMVALNNSEAAQRIPVKIEGTVTYVQPQDEAMFIQQEGIGVYIDFKKDIGLLPGDRVEVSGFTSGSFRPEVSASDVRFLAHGSLPVPSPANFEDLIQAKWDSIYVTLRGHVLSAAMDTEQPNPGLRFQVKVPQGLVGGVVAHPGNLRPEDLLGADVRLTGVAGGAFDSKMQM